MDPEELESIPLDDGADLEAIPMDEGRPRRTRRVVLGETAIEAGGPTRMDTARDRIETGHVVDADAPIADVPETQKAPPSGPTAQQRDWWEDRETDRQLSQTSAGGDVARTILGLLPGARGLSPDVAAAPGRLASRAQRAGEQWMETVGNEARPPDQSSGVDRRGEAMATGAADALSLGFADEMRGVLRSDPNPDSYRRERDRARAEMAETQQQAPSLFAAGEAVGTLPLLAAPNPATAGGRVLMGAAMGGLGAAGHSEADVGTSDFASDTAIGAALGGGLAAGGEGLMRLARGPGEGAARQRVLEELATARDDSLLAATGHAGHNRGAVEAFDFGDTRAQVAASRGRAAQVLRDTGAVPAVAGIRGTRRSIEGALGRTTATMDDVRTAMGSRGPDGREIAQRLRDLAGQDRSVAGEPTRAVLLDLAERFGGVSDDPARAADEQLARQILDQIRREDVPREVYDPMVEQMLSRGRQTAQSPARQMTRSPDEPIDYEALMEEVGNLRDAGAWRTRAGRDVPLGERARRQVDRALRAAYDDAIEAQAARAQMDGGPFRGMSGMDDAQRAAMERLGDDPVAAYRTARQRYAVLDTALENAQRGEAAVAGNRGIGMSEMQWGGAGMGAGASIGASFGALGAGVGAPIGAAAGAGAARALRAVEPRLRAQGADLAYRTASAWPEMTPAVEAPARRILDTMGRVGAARGGGEVGEGRSEARSSQDAGAWLSETLRTNPQALGQYAEHFTDADPQEAARIHFQLSQSDPGYRAQIARARAEER